MKRAYLEEDIELIQKYFPGARSVTFRTPFDLRQRSACPPRQAADSSRGDTDAPASWLGDLLWTN